MRNLNLALTLLAIVVLMLACQPLQAPMAPANSVALRSQNTASSILSRFVQNQYHFVFDEHDKNRNGFIEPAEIPHAAQSFGKYDSNRDGALSPAEILPTPTFLRAQSEALAKDLRQSQTPQQEDPQLQLPFEKEFSRLESGFIREVEVMRSLAQTSLPSLATKPIPVLLVPGYAEPSWYFMYGIYRDLKKAGYAVEGINLFPNFASAEEQALKVKAKAEAMMKQYGSPKIHLVVHSFGGLISRHYIQNMGGSAVVDQLVTIATPHLGTYAAFLGPGESAVQLRPESAFLKKLNAQGFAYPPVKYTSIWSNLDEIVLPPKHSIMPDSQVFYVPWTGHLTIMFSQRTYTAIRQVLN
ncbi:MAG: alpha/beta fold hydrolase [Candidatus Sericytochromatia bacterium]